MFHGPMSAVVTPFNRGKVDHEAYAKLIEFQIRGGVTGLIACGTTGEAATLADDERIATVEAAVRAARGRVPVIAGTGSNDTAHTVRLTRLAEEAGASGALVVTPYYNKSTPAGQAAHFRKVASATRLPLVLYNVPSRTGVNLAPQTIADLFHGVKNIVAVKEASGSVAQSVEILLRTRGRMTVLSGEDPLFLPLLSVGAAGIISVTANVAPRKVAALYRAFKAGDLKRARRLHEDLWPLTAALFSETNPIPVKAALAMMGLIREEYRLPLVRIGTRNRKLLRRAPRDAGVLKG